MYIAIARTHAGSTSVPDLVVICASPQPTVVMTSVIASFSGRDAALYSSITIYALELHRTFSLSDFSAPEGEKNPHIVFRATKNEKGEWQREADELFLSLVAGFAA